MREEEIKQLEIDKIHWRDLYWEECEKNKKLKEEYGLMEKAEEDEKKKLVSPLNEMIDKRVLEEIKKLRKALYILTEKYGIRKVFKGNTLLYERKDSDCNLLDDEE